MFKIQNEFRTNPICCLFRSFVFRSFEFVSCFDIRISNLRVSYENGSYMSASPNFKLPFLGTAFMRRGSRCPIADRIKRYL